MNGAAIAHLYTLDAGVVRGTLDGVTDEETFIQPPQGGNCMNWLLGHIVAHRAHAIRLTGEEPPVEDRVVTRYDRGSEPVTGPGEDTASTEELLTALHASHEQLTAFLGRASAEALAAPRPGGPSRILGETVGQALAALAWHEGYHAGQLGILRRMVGRPGVVK